MHTRPSAKAAGAPVERTPLGEDQQLPPEDRSEFNTEPPLQTLYREHFPRLLRFFSRRTACPEEARDLVHDVFSRIISFGGRRRTALEKPEAYISRVATNLLKDRARASSRRSSHLHVVASEEVLPAVDQEKLLETRDMLHRVEGAMLRLKPTTREIFMAHRLDGLSYAEIAEKTGLSVKGVEKQMSKAISEITRTLNRR